jgi:hypothetical protein
VAYFPFSGITAFIGLQKLIFKTLPALTGILEKEQKFVFAPFQ